MRRTDRELLQDALNALYQSVDLRQDPSKELMTEIRNRLAECDPEPAAWLAVGDGKVGLRAYLHKENALDHTNNIEPLYRYPRQPVLLTDEEIGTLYGKTMNVIMTIGVSKSTFARIVRKAEEKILSKNFDK